MSLLFASYFLSFKLIRPKQVKDFIDRKKMSNILVVEECSNSAKAINQILSEKHNLTLVSSSANKTNKKTALAVAWPKLLQ